MSMRRFTRLTNAFSKKVENLEHAVSLHFMYYNFCRKHMSLKGKTAAGASLMAMGQVVEWGAPSGLGAMFTAVGTAIGAGLAGYTGALRASRGPVAPGVE